MSSNAGDTGGKVDVDILVAALEDKLKPYTDPGLCLECDGFTRVAHTALRDIPHRCMFGEVRYRDATFKPHFWIEVEVDGVVIMIDYHWQRWFPRIEERPHEKQLCKQGVFLYLDTIQSIHSYRGQPIEMDYLPDPLFQAMTTPFPKELMKAASRSGGSGEAG